ncbi:MAG: MATE family efflux transporter, partial [Bacteroidales bacterium]|nr:MATE family efflux transporter [Bacteroidales bacterium]
EMASKGLRLMNMAAPIIGFQMIATNLFQCLGMVHKSIFLSLARQILCLIPLLYLMPICFGPYGVWCSFPIADTISSILTIILLADLLKKFSRLKDGDEPAGLGSKI